MKKFVLIDSHAIIHRAYHALPPLSTPSGEAVNAVYGFTTILMRIMRELKPDYIAAAFDLPGPTFRHAAYERYKATRPETPSDLASQFSKVREVLEAFGIPVFQRDGYEADDIIGTIAEKMKKVKAVETVIVTGDMDALQLVRPGVKVYAMRKGISDTVMYDTAAVRERYGFSPDRIVDFKGLKGDPSDNIPGVKGIGEKTATELIQAFGSIDGIYHALKKKNRRISPAVAARMHEGEEDAKLSRELATIHKNVPIDFDLGSIRWAGSADTMAVRALFAGFGFMSLLKRLNESTHDNPRGEQASLLMPGSGNAAEQAGTASVGDFKKFAARAKKNRIGIFAEKGTLVFIIDSAEAPHIIFAQKSVGEKPVRDFLQSHKNMYAYDAKSLIHILRTYEVRDAVFKFDLMLAAYIGESFSRDFSLPAIVAREVPGETRVIEGFFPAIQGLEAKLDQGRLREVSTDIEMPVIHILADMEERGVLIDRPFLSRLAKKVDGEIAGLTRDIHALAGTEFNINSSQQLSVILFDRLGIKTHGLRKTAKGGVISTRESELDKLKPHHPIIEGILSYRELAKLKTTYIDVLPTLVDEKTGRLHTTFNQTGTSTGRLSSSDPNLQNIPILSQTGREIRKAFVAPHGFSFVSFDYSQIELRVAAHLAEDQKMIEAFRKGMDIHALTAAEIYNVPLGRVTPELRRAAKTLNFGVLYGMGATAFAEGTGVSREESKKFIDEYFRDFSGIRDYIERTKAFAREQGYVESLFGRRRYIPEILSSNPRARSEAERMAINMPIQGTATGDIVKLAMIRVDEWIRKEKLDKDIRMLIQVHDELVFEIKKGILPMAVDNLKRIMENVVKLSVPIFVNTKAGPNWGEQKVISGAD